MKKIHPFIFILLVSLILQNCSDSNDPDTYDLKLVNSFNTDLTIYLKSSASSSDFENRGTLIALDELLIEELIIDSDYTIRAVQFGDDPDDFVFQKTIKNTDSSVDELTVTVGF